MSERLLDVETGVANLWFVEWSSTGFSPAFEAVAVNEHVDGCFRALKPAYLLRSRRVCQQ